MSTWGGVTPGVIAAIPPFPELYIRSYLNDEGILPSEMTPLQRVVDIFTIAVGQNIVNLSMVPSQLFSPIVYRNSHPQYPTVDYIINSQTVTFPPGILQTGDILTGVYTH